MSRGTLGVLILVAIVIVVVMQALFSLRITSSPSEREFTTGREAVNSGRGSQQKVQPSAAPTELASPSSTSKPTTALPPSVCPLADAPMLYLPIPSHNEGTNRIIVDQLESLQGGPVPLDIFYGNITPPAISSTASRITYNLSAPQTQAAYNSSIWCQEVLGLPTGADGKWLFNIALAPGQIPARSLLLATEPMNVHIYDEGLSEKGKRSSGDYMVVIQDAGQEDNITDENLYPESDKHKYKGRYGFSPSKVIGGERQVISMEVYAGLGRWSTFRNRDKSEAGMRSIFSATYISYISITSYKHTSANQSNSTIVRWHSLGALPTVSLVTFAALKKFRSKYFGENGYGVREGLEDCLFIPPFTSPSNLQMGISSLRRRFVMCGFGVTFTDGQMFIGEVTSRFEKGCAAKNRLITFDNEWIPVMDDPVGFNVTLGSKNDHISMNKNWNTVNCDYTAIRAQQHQSSATTTVPPLGWVICLQTSAAPVSKTVAFDMDARKVVASWESRNEAQGAIKIRNGKGVIPLLSHEIPQLQQMQSPPTTSASSSSYPKNLVLFHIREGDHYSMLWGQTDNHAPYAIQKYGVPTYSKNTSTYNSSEPSTPLRPWRVGSSDVEYVRSISLSQNRENVYFSYSDDDQKGQLCTVPLWRAVQASIGNLH